MESESRYHRNTVILLATAGVMIGVAHSIMAAALRSAFETAGALPTDSMGMARAKGGPFVLVAIASLAFGWGSSWLAEIRRIVSWTTVVLSAILAVGVGYGLSVLLSGPLPQLEKYAFVLAAVAFSGAGLARQKYVS